LPTLAQIRSDFAVLDEWEDRYRYVIELGRTLAPLPDALRTDANKVRGCASQVWLATSVKPGGGAGPRLEFVADSDAHIVRGLIAILFAIFNCRSAQEILETNPDPIFAELGLKEHLTPQRSNGLASMVARIRTDATAAAAPRAAAH
jgi:cysteine desulfuration protein SufE